MSLQVFLQAQLLGSEEFLGAKLDEHSGDTADLVGRCAWLNLICEVVPRALLAELKLSRMLLGSSSAEQFLLVLAEEDVPRANQLLDRVAQGVAELSGGTLRLIWATTENLGAWPIARQRLDDALSLYTSAPLAQDPHGELFAPFLPAPEPLSNSYFASFAESLPSAAKVGWSNERPAHLIWDEGEFSWPLREQSNPEEDGILFPRRFALAEDGRPASPFELAHVADGAPRWGVLLGDVDQIEAQLKRAGSIEDHIQLSLSLKEFFAGELSLLCTMPDFWRKTSILYRGGDDFAVIGSWDALLLLAREMQRLFEKFVEANLQTYPGLEGKTVSMALALAPEIDSPPVTVFMDAISRLRQTKATENGTFFVFGRTLEWKRLGDAEELKTSLVRLVTDFGYSPDYIHDLTSVYREGSSASARVGLRKATRVDKPWRMYMRLARVMPLTRGKEVNNLRVAVIASLIGKRTAVLKLRPSGRVGLEWARLATGAAN